MWRTTSLWVVSRSCLLVSLSSFSILFCCSTGFCSSFSKKIFFCFSKLLTFACKVCGEKGQDITLIVNYPNHSFNQLSDQQRDRRSTRDFILKRTERNQPHEKVLFNPF